VDVKFPLNVMTVVTGVSGSGKSSLVRDIFYEGVKHHLDDAPLGVPCLSLTGDLKLVKAIEFVDQNSIGKSSRSNPVTYMGAYDEIRKLYADQALARQLGFTNSVKSSQTNILIRDLAKLITQNGHEIGQQRLYEWMVKNKYLIRHQRFSKSKGKYDNYYTPTQLAAKKKCFWKMDVLMKN
jgi:ABC-type cobalamin/Fe3+-siderophores transport system ATPase subunit